MPAAIAQRQLREHMAKLALSGLVPHHSYINQHTVDYSDSFGIPRPSRLITNPIPPIVIIEMMRRCQFSLLFWDQKPTFIYERNGPIVAWLASSCYHLPGNGPVVERLHLFILRANSLVHIDTKYKDPMYKNLAISEDG